MWQNQQFWEAAFNQDVQKDIKALYLPRMENSSHSHGSHTPHTPHQSRLGNSDIAISPVSPREVQLLTYTPNHSTYYFKKIDF